MLQCIALLVFVAFSNAHPTEFAAKCGYPNNTATAIHTFGCDGQFKTFIRSAKIVTSDGSANYPVDFKKPIVVVLDAENDAEVYYANKVTVSVAKYSTSWFNSQCRWIEIPTFGILNKLDGCKFAHNCPLQKGKLTMSLPLDLSGLSGVISMLAGDTPYQLKIQMYNANPGTNGNEEIACVVTQMKLSP